jgi:RNA polymerase sigma-70 factor (ECF subfamily)
LYVIAANVCRDELAGRARRACPTDEEWEDYAAPVPARASVDDPGELAITRDAVRGAFSVAFELLPPRQRAVLVLRDVLSWRSSEVAELLGTTVAAVNSLQQRARRSLTLRASSEAAMRPYRSVGPVLLTRYLDAFEERDVVRLVALARHEGTKATDQTPSSESAASTRCHA